MIARPVTSILSDIDVNVESREVEDCHRIGKSHNGSKKIIIRFVNRRYWKKPLLHRNQLERIDLKKHQLVSGTKFSFLPAFGFQLQTVKRKELDTFTKNGTVYIKQNENSRPAVILNMNVLHDMFPNFCDLSKEENENRDISGHQNVFALSS